MCHLLGLLGAHHILHISRMKVNLVPKHGYPKKKQKITFLKPAPFRFTFLLLSFLYSFSFYSTSLLILLAFPSLFLTFTLYTPILGFTIMSHFSLSLLHSYLTVLPFPSFKTALLRAPFDLRSLYLLPAFQWTFQSCPHLRFSYTCTLYLPPCSKLDPPNLS